MAAKPQLCRRHYGLRTIVLLRRRCEARMCGWMCAEHFAKQNVRKNVVVCKNAFDAKMYFGNATHKYHAYHHAYHHNFTFFLQSKI